MGARWLATLLQQQCLARWHWGQIGRIFVSGIAPLLILAGAGAAADRKVEKFWAAAVVRFNEITRLTPNVLLRPPNGALRSW
jgi:hypothetical protein